MSRPDPGPLDGEPTRLHPAVLGVWALQGVFSIVVIVVLTGIVPAAGAAMLAVIVATMVLRYLRFRWRLEPDALIIDEGIFIRKRRVIRRERIQTVDLERGISHRILGVVEVRIEAIGAGGTEGKLSAVDPATADTLRRILLGRERRAGAPWTDGTTEGPRHPDETGHPDETEALPESADARPSSGERIQEPAASRAADSPEVEERVRTVVPPERLVVAGMTGGRVGVAAALVGFLFQTIPEDWWMEGLGFLAETTPDPTSVVGIRILVVLAIFALLGGFFLSVVATVFTHWDFTLSETDETLGVRRGLFTEHRDTVPYRRIQAVQVEENVVRRLLGLGAVRVVVAGRAGGGGNEGTDLLLPIGKRHEVYQIARDVVGLEGEGRPPLERMPWRARSRRYVRALVAAAVVAALVGLVVAGRLDASWWPGVAVAFGSVLLPGLALAEGAYRGLGWTDEGDHLVVSEGVLNRRTTFVRTDRLQVLETSQNPFQRLGGLATLHLRVARPLLGSSPRALDLGADGAQRWREAVARRVGRPTDRSRDDVSATPAHGIDEGLWLPGV